VVRAVLLRPLPFRDPGTLFWISSIHTGPTGEAIEYAGGALDFVRWKAATRTLQQVEALTILLGLVLAAVGVYGVTASLLGERTREVAVRMALGARDRDVMRMLIVESLRWVSNRIQAPRLPPASNQRSTIDTPLAATPPEVPMTRRAIPYLLPALMLLPMGSHFGGWAVITVKDLPDYVEAGKPVPVAFVVRQHGVTMLGGLRPTIQARFGRLDTTVAARASRQAGHYDATLTLPRAGEWIITIKSGFGNSNVTLLPVRALEPGARPIAMVDADRGRRLFVAKGCVTCHVHKEMAGAMSIAVGPELTNKRFAPDYLAKWLADPSITPSSGKRSTDATMPNLELAPREIAALVAFINADRQVSAR
jgi:hypothetical protein